MRWTMVQQTKILDEVGIERSLSRISHEIIERNKGVENVVLIGIKTRGIYLAERIAANIEKFEGVKVQVHEIDISLYRDDLSELVNNGKAILKGLNISASITGKKVILIDDVLYTGRTVRAALDAITDIGRSKNIQLAVLVDRGHRELPIRADYVGKNIPTSRSEKVSVQIKEHDGKNQVVVSK